jgi:twinkle protein
MIIGSGERVMALYDFDVSDAERFARERGIRTHKYGKQLVFQTCPYCNGGRNHDTDTFAIGLDNGAFNCKRSSCNMTGNMITLAKDFNFNLSDSVERYLQRGEYHKDNYKPYKYEYTEPKDGAVKYLLGRAISEKVCRKYEITMKDDNRTLVIPFKDEDGVV